MFKVTIDTNVIVSALMSPGGNPYKILDWVTDEKLKLCYSQEILDEYIDVLSRPHFKFSSQERDNFIQGVQRFGLSVQPLPSYIPLPDEDDRCFYDVAKLSEAILITGNIKHYPVEPFIVTPSEFVALFE